MKNRMRKFFAELMAVVMTVTLIPGTASADVVGIMTKPGETESEVIQESETTELRGMIDGVLTATVAENILTIQTQADTCTIKAEAQPGELALDAAELKAETADGKAADVTLKNHLYYASKEAVKEGSCAADEAIAVTHFVLETAEDGSVLMKAYAGEKELDAANGQLLLIIEEDEDEPLENTAGENEPEPLASIAEETEAVTEGSETKETATEAGEPKPEEKTTETGEPETEETATEAGAPATAEMATEAGESETEEMATEGESEIVESAETELDTEAESEVQAPAETELDTEAESEAGVPAETEPDTEAESEAEVPAETELDTEAESEAGIPAETELDAEAESESELLTPAETELDAEAESESELLTPAEMESESETESEFETEAEIVTTTKDVDGTVIEVSYPADAFEEEVTLEATAITEGDQQYEEVKNALDELQENDESFRYGSFVAFDITFLSVETGEMVEPLKEVSVSIKLNEGQKIEEAENTNLVHIPEESGKAEVVENAQISADATEVTFQNDEFSPYSLTFGPGEKPVTVTFADGTKQDFDGPVEAVAEVVKSKKDATFTLNEDVHVTEQIRFEEGYTGTYTLDLNGHTIDATGSNTRILSIGGGNITVINGTLTGGNSTKAGAAVYIGTDNTKKPTLLMQNVTMKDNASTSSNGGGAFCSYGQTTVTLEKCEISGNTALFGGGISVYGSTGKPNITIADCVIKDNTATKAAVNYGGGGGIYITGGSSSSYARTVNIRNTTVSGNTANRYGAGIDVYSTSYANITLDNCQIVNNTISGGNTSYNIPLGAGIYFSSTGGKMTVNGGSVSGNAIVGNASGNKSMGGGIGVGTAGTLTLNGTKMDGNTAGKGGGIFASGAETILNNVPITNNTADGITASKPGTAGEGGGGIYVASAVKSFKMNSVTMGGNKASSGFGASILIDQNARKVIAIDPSLEITSAEGSENSELGFVFSTTDYNSLIKDTRKKLRILPLENPDVISNELLSSVQVAGASDRFTAVKETGTEGYGIYVNASPDVYVDGAKGDDANEGTKDKPVKTYEKAEEILIRKDPEGKTSGYIFVKDTLTVSKDATWPTDDWGSRARPVLVRYDNDTTSTSDGFKGYLVDIKAGVSLTLKNIVIDGNKASVATSNAALVKVDGGSLTIKAGAVLRNNAHGSTAPSGGTYVESGGAIYSNNGTIMMDGGTISGNSAYRYGGGIELWGGSMTLTRGTIENNEVTSVFKSSTSATNYATGGGICALNGAKLTMSGGTVRKNSANWSGGGIALGTEAMNPTNGDKKTMTGPTLTMTDGTIEGNTSNSDGGGIYLQATCSAEISGGNIINNVAHKSDAYTKSWYGGGGIYVNGGKGGYPDGYLHLTNVEVTDNKGGSAGGLAACWTSTVKIHLTNGGAIYGNSKKNGENLQIYINKNDPDSGIYGTYSGLTQSNIDSVDISYYMLGGGAYRWMDEDGNYIPLNGMQGAYRQGYFLGNNPSADSIKKAKDNVKVRINGNSSNIGGGAIGTNGSVEIGTADYPSTEVTVTKNWENDINDAYKEMLDNVNIWLLAENGGNVEYVGHQELYSFIDSRADHVEEGSPSREWKNSVTFTKLKTGYNYIVLEEYILKSGVGENNVTHILSKNGKAYESVISGIMGGTPYIWSDDADAYYDDKITGDQTAGYTITNYPAVTTEFKAQKRYWIGDTQTEPKSNEFAFTITRVDAEGNALTGGDAYSETVSNNADGTVNFTNIRYLYEKDGENTYYYKITEDKGTNKGIAYDAAEYMVKVEVAFEAGSTKLTAAKTITTGSGNDVKTVETAEFSNTYTAKGSLALDAQKTLSGRTLEAGQFSFTLTAVDENGDVLQVENEAGELVPAYTETVTNDGDGKVDFKALEYTEADIGQTYYYQVTEEAVHAAGYTYDPSVYTVTVSVADNGDGTLDVEKNITVAKDGAEEAAESIAFTNAYTAKGSLDLNAQKTLSGRTLEAGQFSFTLTAVDENGDELQVENEAGELVPAYTETVKNDGDGKVDFKALEYTEADIGQTYHYQVTEEAVDAAGYTYDPSVYTVTVSVADNGDGTLDVEKVVTVAKDGAEEAAESIAFANAYTASGQLALEAQKTLSGATLTEGQFSFTLTAVDADGNTLTGEDAYTETVTNAADGKVTFAPIQYTEENIGEDFIYTVTEAAAGADGVTYDGTVYTVRVHIGDNGDGTLDVQRTVTRPAAEGETPDADGNVEVTDLTFANTFAGSVTLTKRSEASTPENPELLAGAEFQLYYRADEAADGTQYGETAYVTSEDGTLTVDGLPAGDYYFVETKAPAGYVVTPGTDGNPAQYPFTIAIGGGQAAVHATLDVTNAPEPEPEAIELTVTKQLVYENELWNAVDETFYVALYGDEELTDRVTDIQPIVFQDSNTSSTTFTGLEYDRTYYVGETNDEGVVLNTMGGVIASGQSFSVDFNEGNAATLTREDGTQEITFRNVFAELPPEFYREGTLTVTKRLLGADGVEKAADRTFYAGIFSDAGYTQLSSDVNQNIVELALNGSSTATATVTVTVPQGGSMTVYVTEVDKDGRPVEGAASFQYDVTVEGTTITMDEENLSGETVITNQEREEETEEETELETESRERNEDDGDEIIPATTSSVKTGDETPLGLYIGLMAAAAVLILLLLAVRRKRRQK